MIQKKICMLGGFAVGKTSLVARYVTSLFSEKYLTTVGVNIDKKQVPVGGKGDYRYPDLAKKISDEWNTNGSHRAGTDNKLDQAVLHSDNSTPFSDVVAVIDAIYTPKRDFNGGGKTQKIPAFNVTFAVN